MKSASADHQLPAYFQLKALILAFSLREKGPPLPLGEGGGEGSFTTASRPSTKGEAVLSVLNCVWIFKMSQSAAAPETIRAKVNVAASIVVCLSASRQSNELLANAIIAADVSKKRRADLNSRSGLRKC